MKKPFMIPSVLFLLSLSVIVLFLERELDESKFWNQIEKGSAVCGVVMTWDGKPVYNNYIGFSETINENCINNLTSFRMGSMLDFEIISGFKIAVFIKANNYELINNTNKFFKTKIPSESKFSEKLTSPVSTTPTKYKEKR